MWILIYGGLFAVVLGLATEPLDAATGWTLLLAGLAVTVAGVVLVFVRSRLAAAPPPPGAQSDA